MAKKKVTTYPIVLHVSEKGRFRYTLEGNPSPSVDPTFLQVNYGDSVSWQVLHGRRKTPVPFQVEFGVFNPLKKKTNTVIRSRGERTAPVFVDLEDNFRGNLIFKYTISTLNGWWQDPDIVPVPSDGVLGGKKGKKVVAGRVLTPAITLSVGTDPSGKRIVEFQPEPESLGPGLVVWQWAPNSPEADDFVLSFENTGGYFPGPVNSASQKVALPFPKPTSTQTSIYDVVTKTENLQGTGHLTIKPSPDRRRAGRGRRTRRS